jgi:sulfur carrier protein
MTVTINGTPNELPEGLTVAQLLEQKQLAGKPCAVEINKTLVPKARHAETVINEGDTVELVTLVGGG